MAQTIDRLLNLVVDKPDQVLQHLQTNPELASQQDRHGYSLLHAAASYNHPDVLRTLFDTYSVNPNLIDEDGETCLYSVETVDMAKFLIEQCNVDATLRNEEGQTAAEKFEQEGDFPEVAAYLASLVPGGAAASILSQTGNPSAQEAAAGTVASGQYTNGTGAPPPLPNGVKIDLGTMGEDEVGEAPDPEFRRRIDELAARPDFQSEETQRELRELVQDALGGLGGGERDVRQRTS
jgi:ankyrin repeat protein